MADITSTVGERAQNQRHDVALVQLMLRVVTNAHRLPYLSTNYDGVYTPALGAAIAQFQADHGLATQSPAVQSSSTAPSWQTMGGLSRLPFPGAPTPLGAPACTPAATLPFAAAALATTTAGGAKERGGTMDPGGATIRKLTELLPQRLKGMRTMPGWTVPYLAEDAGRATTSAKAIAGYKKFHPDFRTALARLVTVMFERTGVVLWVTDSGWRRTFEEQYQLFLRGPDVTGAGPGESNHNWGNGTDIGPHGLRWLRHDGSEVRDNYWLVALEKVRGGEWMREFWRARNAIAVGELGLFPSKKKSDFVHLQAFDDDKVHMARALVALLNDVGDMGWSYINYVNDDYVYGCDMGGSTKVKAGTAAEIWSKQAPIDAAAIAKATGKPAASIKPEDVTAMQAKMRDDWEKADNAWEKWKAVYK